MTVFGVLACGGGSQTSRPAYDSPAYGPYNPSPGYREGVGYGESDRVYAAEESAYGSDEDAESYGDEFYAADLRETAGNVERSGETGTELAQATTPGPEPESPEPILIYTATLYMGVYQVEQSQQAVVALASELGGFLFSQDDVTVVIRIPAQRFEEALERLEALGDVLHRNIQVQDVSEEFHDLNVRLETLHAMRARLEDLLARAATVAEALQIERELQRITMELETIEGRLRFLRDRIAFSTITVTFQSNVPNVQAQAPVRLPFEWIPQLGLNNLLSLW